MYKVHRFNNFSKVRIELMLQEFFDNHDIEIIKIHFFDMQNCILIYKEKGE